MNYSDAINSSHKYSKRCCICGLSSTGIRCGVQSCSACAVFFRRSIRMNSKYVCQKDLKCFDNGGNHRCTYCRLRKCYAVGMSLDKNHKRPLNRVLNSHPEPTSKSLESLESIYKNYRQQREIRQQQEQSLLFHGGSTEVKLILSTEMIASNYLERLKLSHVSFLTNSFQCFRELDDEEKLIIFDSSISLIVGAELYYLSYNNFPPEKHDNHYMMSDYSYVSYDTTTHFWNNFKSKTSQENFELLATKMRDDLFNTRKGTTIMAQMEIMDEEYAAILALCTWCCVLRGEVISEKIRNKCSIMKKHIFKELQELYKRKNIENYFERLADITTLLAYVDADAQQMVDNFALIHVFDSNTETSLMHEYSRTPDFHLQLAALS